MNDLSIFNYEENEVRTVNVDGDVWFVGKDIADILGIPILAMQLGDIVRGR